MLELTGVKKSFIHNGNVIDVLRGIDTTVSPGESIAVLGASGVGKSTLLNIMGSLEAPTEGRVMFNGVDIYEMDQPSLSNFRNRQVGFVFQFHHLLPEFNALENAMMPAMIARLSRREASKMASEYLERVGLGGRMSHRAGELSGGEQQRVAIARALVMKPKLILADEPTGNLDWSTGHEVAELLLRLMEEEGTALVIATHNQELAGKMTRKMELASGKIQ